MDLGGGKVPANLLEGKRRPRWRTGLRFRSGASFENVDSSGFWMVLSTLSTTLGPQQCGTVSIRFRQHALEKKHDVHKIAGLDRSPVCDSLLWEGSSARSSNSRDFAAEYANRGGIEVGTTKLKV